jgi:hypothetical protein
MTISSKTLRLELLERGGERDVDVVAEVLNLDALELVFREVVIGEHADDREPEVVDLDRLADGREVAEELLLHARADDAVLLVLALVRLGEQAALGEFVFGEAEVRGRDADDARIVALAAEGENLERLDALARGVVFDFRRDGLNRLHVA